jgi:hypothetical protein
MSRAGRYSIVKTARFATVVQKCGKPEVYLALTDPARDRSFQAAIKAQRVMTVQQENVGARSDRGEVGFQSGPGRQYLIFPKSLRSFSGRTVIGIKYDLLAPPQVSKRDLAPPPRPPQKNKEKPQRVSKSRRAMPPPDAHAKIPSRTSISRAPKDEIDDVTGIKKQIRRAIADLERGKTVAAFKRLKHIVDDDD